jgi:hypothetical protein
MSNPGAEVFEEDDEFEEFEEGMLLIRESDSLS